MMFDYMIRSALPADVHSAAAVEAAAFPPAEAAPETAIAQRIALFPERFFVAETPEDGIIGIINGCASNKSLITDDMFETGGHDPRGKNQMIFGLAVLPRYRRLGVGGALLERMISFAAQSGMSRVILTCKEEKLHYYAGFGFENAGLSASVHGGARWYDMIKTL